MSAVLTWRTVTSSPPLRHYSLVSCSASQSHNHCDSVLFVRQNILRWSNSRSLSFANHPNHLLGPLCSSMADSDSSNDKRNSAGPAYAEIVVIRHGETEWNADGRIQLGVCQRSLFFSSSS